MATSNDLVEHPIILASYSLRRCGSGAGALSCNRLARMPVHEIRLHLPGGRGMNEAGHRQAIEDLLRQRAKLDPHTDIRLYAEACFLLAFNYVAVGSERRHGQHQDNHQGLSRWLRARGHDRQASIMVQMEQLRAGRVYGNRGDGDTAKQMDSFVAELEAWALA